MDGEITIGTKLSTDKFDRQIANLEKKMKKEEDKKIEIEAKIKDINVERIDKQIQKIKDKIEKTTNAPATLEINANIANAEKELEQYDIARAKAKEYKRDLDELRQKQREMWHEDPTLATSRDTGEYKQIKDDIQDVSRLLQESNQKILETAPHIDEVSNSLERLKEKQTFISNKILEYKNTIETLNTQKQQEINNKTEQYTKQLQEVNNNISQYKQQIESVNLQKQVSEVQRLKNGFNSVGNSIQNAVKRAAKLALGIFGIRSAYIALRRASSDLASYDQQYAANLEYIRFVLTQAIAPILRAIVNLAMQLLQYINMIAQAWFGVNLFANGSVEAFNKMKKGASGVSKAVKEIKKQLLGFDEINMLTDQSDTGTSAGASGVGIPDLDLSKIQGEVPDWLQWIIDHGELVRKIIEGIGGALVGLKLGIGGLKGLGIGLVIDGIIDLVKNIKDFVKEPTVQKFGKILASIGKILIGLSIAIGALPLAVLGQIAMVIGGIVETFGAWIDFFKDPSWEKWAEAVETGIKMTGLLGYAIDWLVENVFGGWDGVTNLLIGIGQWLYDNVVKPVQDKFSGLWETIKKIFEPVVDFFKTTFETVWSNIQVIVDNVKLIFTVLWENIKTIFQPVADFFGNIFNQAVEKIKSVFSSIVDFFRGIWDKIYNIFAPIGAKIGEVIGNSFRTIINGILGAVENILNVPIRGINSLIGAISSIPGLGGLKKLNTFSFPRMKTGGIINMPNKGTMIGGAAIGGEAGREGVVPLTDQQAMSELGREIGKNVVLNTTNIISMNGRVIGRELKQVNAEQEFAFNT